VRLDDLRFAPCVGRLRALEGVHLASEADEEDAIKLIRAAKRLEFLGLVWVGAEPDAPDMDADYSEAKQLVLPNLHTVTLVAGRPGPLLAALTRADLPVLSRFVTSPYEPGLAAFDADADRGGPRAFQVAHGGVIRSLTYVSTPGWPRRDLVPPADTLALHPNLVHLHLAIPHTLLNEHPELGAALQSSTHPLAVLALPRWPKVMYGADTSPAPTPAMTPGVQGQPPGFPPTPPPEWGGPPPPGRHAFLTALVPLTRVKTIVVDGFTWVQPALGRWAAESGDSGVMRQWANWLVRRGIELCDQEGNVAPVIERGRGSFSSTSGFRPPIMGRKSVDGGRRSFDSGWPR
jgi:hypothetical protein